MKTFSILVTGNGTYNTFDGGNSKMHIGGGFSCLKFAGVASSIAIGSPVIVPQINYGEAGEDGWAPILSADGATVKTITAAGLVYVQPLHAGMQLRFVVTGYSIDFTIKGL